MEFNLSYFLHVSIAIAVFYLAYLLLFRKEKIFLFNRLYLIVSMIVSFIIPHITFHKQIVMPEVVMSIQSTEFVAASPTALSGFNIQLILKLLFLSGFVFFLSVMIIGHLKVWWIVHKSSKDTLYGHMVWIINKNIPPFTYFGKLIIPFEILNSPHLLSVVFHEQIHAKGQHCIDLCLAELLFLFQWFNPFAWLIKNAIKENLEFLTDNETIGYIDKEEYQLSMVSLASKNTFYTFPSISNQSQLKKRIIMIKKNKTSKFPWIKSLVIIPILTILTVTLSGREVQIIYSTSDIEEKVHVAQQNDIDITINESNDEEISKAIETKSTESKIVQEKEIRGKVTDMEGKAIVGVSVTVNGSTIGTTTNDDGNYHLSIIPANAVLSFTMNGYEKKEMSIQISSNSQTNDTDKGAYIISIQLKKSSSTSETEDEILSNDRIYTMFTNSNRVLPIGKNPLYVVDDKKYTPEEFDLLRIKSGEVDTMEIHSWYTAERYYGREAVNGAIIFTTRRNK